MEFPIPQQSPCCWLHVVPERLQNHYQNIDNLQTVQDLPESNHARLCNRAEPVVI